MDGGKLERFFDTKFKRVLFRWLICIFLAFSWILKDVGVNKDIRFLLTSVIWIAYGGLCAYIFKNGRVKSSVPESEEKREYICVAYWSSAAEDAVMGSLIAEGEL